MQVPSHVEYERARSVEHALELLARFGPESRVLAGGHSLIPMMKLRLAQPETLIDINGVSGLSRITVADGQLHIGALVRHASCWPRPWPAALPDPARRRAGDRRPDRAQLGHDRWLAVPGRPVRGPVGRVRRAPGHRGDPGPRRPPQVPVREFHLGPYETVVAPDELLTELRVPIPARGGGSAYEKVARRVGDWSVAAAGAMLVLDAGGAVAEVGIGLAAVGARHFVAAAAEDFLRGSPPARRRSPGPGSSRPSTASPPPISAGRSTTNGT